jgi:chemotaxis response regulator CheB
MPKAAVEAGAAELTEPLDRIGDAILENLTKGN